MNTSNPLMQFARRPELSIKLPSDGNWYEEGFINYTMTGEVEVYPMLPKDELMMLNPDALLSGQANVDLIKSCCPSISDPRKLLYNDVNVILLAIHRATHGSDLEMEAYCPKCQEKITNVEKDVKVYNTNRKENEPEKNADEIISEMEKNGEIITHAQDYIFDIDSMLQQIGILEKEYVMNTPNGLKIYYGPNKLEDRAKLGLMRFNQEKIIKAYKDYTIEDSLTDSEENKMIKEVQQCYLKITDIGNHMITNAILKILLPDDTMITDKEMIYEFISNTPSTIVNELNNRIIEVNEIGIPKTLSYKCNCCGHEWEEHFYGFNQMDFFATGS